MTVCFVKYCFYRLLYRQCLVVHSRCLDNISLGLFVYYPYMYVQGIYSTSKNYSLSEGIASFFCVHYFASKYRERAKNDGDLSHGSSIFTSLSHSRCAKCLVTCSWAMIDTWRLATRSPYASQSSKSHSCKPFKRCKLSCQGSGK